MLRAGRVAGPCRTARRWSSSAPGSGSPFGAARPGRADRAGRRGRAAGRPDGVADGQAPAGVGPRRPGADGRSLISLGGLAAHRVSGLRRGVRPSRRARRPTGRGATSRSRRQGRDRDGGAVGPAARGGDPRLPGWRCSATRAEYSFGGRGAVARAATRAARELVGAAGAALSRRRGVPVGRRVGPAAGAVAGRRRPSPGRRAGRAGRRRADRGRRRWPTPACWSPAGSPPAGCRGATCTSSSLAADASSASLAWLVLLAAPARAAAARPVRHAGRWCVLLGFAGMVLYTEVGPAGAGAQLVLAEDPRHRRRPSPRACSWSASCRRRCSSSAPGYDRGKRRFPYPLGARLPAAETPGAADLPAARVRVPDLDVRRHLRRDLGRGGLGPVLGLGPEGDLVVHLLGRLRRLPARPGHAERQAHRPRPGSPCVAWATMLINLFVINFFAVGLHSYAGVD